MDTSVAQTIAKPTADALLYLEDLQVGQCFSSGRHTLDEAQIRRFAAEFDPQPFHLDEAAPETGLTGGLIASGWHIAAIFMRLLTDSLLLDSTCLGSPGVETLKWAKPLRPGDTLSGRSTVTAARPSQSRPDRGIVSFRHEALNQTGDVVMWMDNTILFGLKR